MQILLHCAWMHCWWKCAKKKNVMNVRKNFGFKTIFKFYAHVLLHKCLKYCQIIRNCFLDHFPITWEISEINLSILPFFFGGGGDIVHYIKMQNQDEKLANSTEPGETVKWPLSVLAWQWLINLILPKPKVISLCHQ